MNFWVMPYHHQCLVKFKIIFWNGGREGKFIGKNKIESLKVNKIKLGEPDETGRRKPEIQKDSDFEIKSDMVQLFLS